MEIPKAETLKLYRQALEVSWLKTEEEVDRYFVALMDAYYWGKKIDEQNKKYKKESLTNKYNNK